MNVLCCIAGRVSHSISSGVKCLVMPLVGMEGGEGCRFGTLKIFLPLRLVGPRPWSTLAPLL